MIKDMRKMKINSILNNIIVNLKVLKVIIGQDKQLNFNDMKRIECKIQVIDDLVHA